MSAPGARRVFTTNVMSRPEFHVACVSYSAHIAATPSKRFGFRSASSAAIRPPCDMPLDTVRRGSPTCSSNQSSSATWSVTPSWTP